MPLVSYQITLKETRTPISSSYNHRKIAMIRLSAEILLDLFKSGESHYRVTSDIPDDAVIIGCEYSPAWDAWEVVFSSESLAEVEIGQLIPIIESPTFEVLNWEVI